MKHFMRNTINDVKKIKRGIAFSALALASSSLISISHAQEREILVPTNMPDLITDLVVTGDTSSIVQFTTSGATLTYLEGFVPIDGANVQIQDSTGDIIASSSNNAIEYFNLIDEELSETIPGGIFTFEGEFPDGTYDFIISYPAATMNTAVGIRTYSQAQHRLGFVSPKVDLLVGEAASFGTLILSDGVPATSLTPSMVFTSETGTEIPVSIADDGLRADGTPNDGLYSGEITFSAPGEYIGIASVDVTLAGGGTVTQTERQLVNVRTSTAAVISATNAFEVENSGCISGLIQTVTASAQVPGDYVIVGGIDLGDGDSISDRRQVPLTGATTSHDLSFDVDALRRGLDDNGILKFIKPRIFSVGESIDLQDTGTAPLDENVAASNFCSKGIVMGEAQSIDQTIVNGFIDKLTFTMPIDVNVPGNYEITYNVIDGSGADVGFFTFNQSLVAGINLIQVILEADDLQNSDGPFEVLSGLIRGPGGGTLRSNLGSSDPYSKWQFTPNLPGDLNNDGSVGGQDVPFIAQSLKDPVLVPGDRRDVNGDGLINTDDIQAVVGN